MGVQTREEQTGPLGILACIMAGFETLGHNLWPLLFPLGIDLFLWLGPQLSVAPLMEWFISFSRTTQSTFDPQIGEVLEQFGEQFNLFSLLNVVPFLSVPTLLSQHAPGAISPLGQRLALPVGNALVLIVWAIVLIPVGLVLGSVYLNALASSVHSARGGVPAPAATIPAASKAEDTTEDVAAGAAAARQGDRPAMIALTTILKLIRVLTFSGILVGLSMLLFPIWMFVVGLAMSIAEILGLLLWGLCIGIAGFVVLHLLFVVHGVLLGERRLLRAIVESVALIRLNFASSAGLAILAILIYKGLGYIWALPAGNSWLLFLGILCNSGIATALVAATFVFYQERVARLPGIGGGISVWGQG
jgi:hypothetical protein